MVMVSTLSALIQPFISVGKVDLCKVEKLLITSETKMLYKVVSLNSPLNNYYIYQDFQTNVRYIFVYR